MHDPEPGRALVPLPLSASFLSRSVHAHVTHAPFRFDPSIYVFSKRYHYRSKVPTKQMK